MSIKTNEAPPAAGYPVPRDPGTGDFAQGFAYSAEEHAEALQKQLGLTGEESLRILTEALELAKEAGYVDN